jgi:o-succinylbenzoate synthase
MNKVVLSRSKRKVGVHIGGVTIEEVVLYRVKILLASRFTISLGSQDYYESVILELHSGQLVGFGEGATIPEITGETPVTMIGALEYILDRIGGKTFESLEAFSESLSKMIQWNTAAKAALDVAVHDLLAKQAKAHVITLIGGHPITKETSITVRLGSVKSTMTELEKYLKAGFKVIKLKVGGEVGTDIQRVREVGKRLGKIPFYVDANQGYTLSNALKLSKALLDTGAQFFEQPLDRNDFDSHRQLRIRGGIPIMLDESIFSPRDVIEAIRKEAADYVNVKLAKSGGIRMSLKTLATAQAYGIDAMVGSMVESKLATAAGLAVASAARNVKFTDLDGHTSLVFHPFEGGIRLAAGVNTLLDGHGFAVRKNF